jgi:hypothetical protein
MPGSLAPTPALRNRVVEPVRPATAIDPGARVRADARVASPIAVPLPEWAE